VPFVGVNSGHYGHHPATDQEHIRTGLSLVRGIHGTQVPGDSQAQSASSILVTRSTPKAQVSDPGLVVIQTFPSSRQIAAARSDGFLPTVRREADDNLAMLRGEVDVQFGFHRLSQPR
jgi:hypothetical protein